MLDTRFETYASRDRFGDAVVGLLLITERTRALALVTRRAKDRSPDGPLCDFFLGLVALGYALRATIGRAPEIASDDAAPEGRGARAAARILR